MGLFGTIAKGDAVEGDEESGDEHQIWACDVPRLVAEIGKGLVATIDVREELRACARSCAA